MRGAFLTGLYTPPVDQDAEKGRQNNGYQEGGPPGQGEHHDSVKRKIATGHHDVAVGEIYEAQNSVDHGVADGNEAVQASQRDAVDQLLGKYRGVDGGPRNNKSGAQR